MLHGRESLVEPEHGRPFHLGAGFVQERVRVWRPMPQLFVQAS